MTVLRLGNGSVYQTVREYLEIVGRNAYSLMAAGAVVQPQTQFLIGLLSGRGDEMDVGQMRKLMVRLGDELGAAQQLAGVTDEDFRRVEAECATAAGLREVERRVDAVVKGQFDGTASSEVPKCEQVPVTTKEKKLNKRLRKKQRKREQAALDAATCGYAWSCSGCGGGCYRECNRDSAR